MPPHRKLTFPGAGPVISIGECMVELARGPDGRFGLAYGGDTFNTAVYMARSGAAVAYATALGDDAYSDGIRQLAVAEGVGTGLIATKPGRMPGLYMIETAANGERSFAYWRERAPARELFDQGGDGAMLVAISQSRLIYFSGVTLSLYAPNARDAFATALSNARTKGARVAMDNNFRPRGWGSDAATAVRNARPVFETFWRLADIALPTFDDEQALWGDASPAETIRRLTALGVAEIVVKNGDEGAFVHHEGKTTQVACPAKVVPVDTTAAGDSFNGGYLAARLRGEPPAQAALAGHGLAAIVIQHRGAIVPRTVTMAVTAAATDVATGATRLPAGS
jgi:2-dehydro-3-deoxygluconokinase